MDKGEERRRMMYFKKGASFAEVLKALVSLEAGNMDDYVTAEIDSPKLEFVQAKKQPDGKYYVEVAKKGGNPKIYDGNQLFKKADLEEGEACEVFLETLKNKKFPRGFSRIMATDTEPKQACIDYLLNLPSDEDVSFDLPNGDELQFQKASEKNYNVRICWKSGKKQVKCNISPDEAVSMLKTEMRDLSLKGISLEGFKTA